MAKSRSPTRIASTRSATQNRSPSSAKCTERDSCARPYCEHKQQQQLRLRRQRRNRRRRRELKCCKGWRLRRACRDFCFCRWCWCCFYVDYDKPDLEYPKRYPPVKPAPKITRREEHVEFIRTRDPKGTRKRTDAINRSSKNEAKIYYCAIKPAMFAPKKNAPSKSAKLNSPGNKEDSKAHRLRKRSSMGAGLPCNRKKNHSRPDDRFRSLITKNTIVESGGHSSLQSNQSLEIKSHVLTMSASQLASIESIFSIKWRRKFRRLNKGQSTLQNIVYKLAHKIKGGKKTQLQKREKKNVLVLHMPKNFSNTSTLGTVSATRNNKKLEKPLVIRDKSSQALDDCCTFKPPMKICGPGEVRLKRSNTMFDKHS